MFALFVVVFSGLSDAVSNPTQICRVDRNKYAIQIPLPPKIDPSVTMMTVEEKPDVTYKDVGGSKEQIAKIREVVEKPLKNVNCSIESFGFVVLIVCHLTARAVCGPGY